MSKKPNVRTPAPATEPAKTEPKAESTPGAPMTDADALHGAIQLLTYAADAGAFASNPKLWGPKAQVLDRLAAMAVRLRKAK